MPTKSKKRRPKKDGHVSYQHVSLAQPNMVLREVDYIVELLLGAIRGSSRSASCCSSARTPVTHGCSIPRIIWRCVRPRLAAASLSQIVETVTRYAIGDFRARQMTGTRPWIEITFCFAANGALNLFGANTLPSITRNENAWHEIALASLFPLNS